MANEAVLRGFDMTVSDIGDQLHFRLPLLSFRSNPTLYVAGRVDWRDDIQALTIVDDPEDLEMATLLADGASRPVASGQGVVVAGAEFFHAASLVGGQLDGFDPLSTGDCECWIRIATPAEFVALKGELIDESRAVFDRELGKASRQGRRLAERGNAAMLILRRCAPLRQEDLALRQLAAALWNQDLDLYRRLLTRFEHELGEPENRLDEQAKRHIKLAHLLERTLWLSDMLNSGAGLVYTELAEQKPWHSISKQIVEFPMVDDRPSSSLSFLDLAAAGPRHFWIDGKRKRTSDILWSREVTTLSNNGKQGTMAGSEKTWDQPHSA